MLYRDKNGKQDAFVDLVFKINLFMYYCIYFCIHVHNEEYCVENSAAFTFRNISYILYWQEKKMHFTMQKYFQVIKLFLAPSNNK